MEKWKTIGSGCMPVVLWIFIQAAVVFSYDATMIAVSGILRNLGVDTTGFLETVHSQELYLCGILSNGITMIPGFIWFSKFLHIRAWEHRKIRGIDWVGLAVLGVALQLITDILLTLMMQLTPGVMEDYGQVLDDLGMFAPTVFSVLYTAVFAPITEELIFRGLTLKILQEGLPFWTANVVQALIFALIHGNMVQGIYAFVSGLILGRIVKKYGSLKTAILCHFAVNVSGLLFGNLSLHLWEMAAGAVLALVILLLLKKTENR